MRVKWEEKAEIRSYQHSSDYDGRATLEDTAPAETDYHSTLGEEDIAAHTQLQIYRERKERRQEERTEGRAGSEVWGWVWAGTSTAMLKSTMDTLVFLCQHTCTVVLPRWGAGLSIDAVMSSSDSTSTEESSGHSGKVRRLLMLDNDWDDVGDR